MASEIAVKKATELWNSLPIHSTSIEMIANVIDELTKPNLHLATNKELYDELGHRFFSQPSG